MSSTRRTGSKACGVRFRLNVAPRKSLQPVAGSPSRRGQRSPPKVAAKSGQPEAKMWVWTSMASLTTPRACPREEDGGSLRRPIREELQEQRRRRRAHLLEVDDDGGERRRGEPRSGKTREARDRQIGGHPQAELLRRRVGRLGHDVVAAEERSGTAVAA